MPIATSTAPSRNGRPQVSVMRTAIRRPVAARISARSRAAEASGSSGSRQRLSGGAFDRSTPELAHTKPWWVSVMSTDPPVRTIRRASATTAWISRGSRSLASAQARAMRLGLNSSSRATRPSDLETTFWQTARQSPSSGSSPARAMASITSGIRASPSVISGSPVSGKHRSPPPAPPRSPAESSSAGPVPVIGGGESFTVGRR